MKFKCFAFDDLGLERRPELDFHANSIRMGNDALIDLNKNDHWFQLISLTGTDMTSAFTTVDTVNLTVNQGQKILVRLWCGSEITLKSLKRFTFEINKDTI